MQIETRPAHLDDWLDTLPYANTEKCIELLESALTQTNKTPVKPNLRFELMELYWLRYRYLLDTKIRSDTHAASQGALQRLRQIDLIKRVALEIAFGCKLAIHDSMSHKALFRASRPPVKGSLLALTAYTHVLLLNFHEYSPTPKNVWREIHELYEHAEALEFLDEGLADPDGESNGNTTLRKAYVRICASALVDPHHLDAGNIWHVYDLVTDWIDDINITPFSPVTDATGVFVIDLHHAGGPVSYSKLKLDRTTPHLRLLYCEKLTRRCSAELDQLSGRTQTGLLDKTAQRVRLLEYVMRAWGDPLRRQLPRQQKSGIVEVAIGINPSYAKISGDTELSPTDTGADEPPTTEQWHIVNEGSEGYALYATERPQSGVRVGDVLALRSGASTEWILATVRWLMIERGKVYKVGAQIASRSAKAIEIKAMAGPEIMTQPRSGFVLDPLKDGELYTLLTSPGLYAPELGLELRVGPQRQSVTAGDLIEQTIAFERFTYQA